jgi:hypothetical protein
MHDRTDSRKISGEIVSRRAARCWLPGSRTAAAAASKESSK